MLFCKRLEGGRLHLPDEGIRQGGIAEGRVINGELRAGTVVSQELLPCAHGSDSPHWAEGVMHDSHTF